MLSLADNLLILCNDLLVLDVKLLKLVIYWLCAKRFCSTWSCWAGSKLVRRDEHRIMSIFNGSCWRYVM